MTKADKTFLVDAQNGIPYALVSLTLRCMHSVVATAHWDDIKHTIDPLSSFVNSLTASDEFSQQL